MADSLENLTPEQRAEYRIGVLTKQLLTDPETRRQTAKLTRILGGRCGESKEFPSARSLARIGESAR